MSHERAIQTLIEEEDPAARVDAHLLLGKRALERSDAQSARQHFREAADLDPTDERPRAALLEVDGAGGPRSSTRTSLWRFLFRGRRAEA